MAFAGARPVLAEAEDVAERAARVADGSAEGADEDLPIEMATGGVTPRIPAAAEWPGPEPALAAPLAQAARIPEKVIAAVLAAVGGSLDSSAEDSPLFQRRCWWVWRYETPTCLWRPTGQRQRWLWRSRWLTTCESRRPSSRQSWRLSAAMPTRRQVFAYIPEALLTQKAQEATVEGSLLPPMMVGKILRGARQRCKCTRRPRIREEVATQPRSRQDLVLDALVMRL